MSPMLRSVLALCALFVVAASPARAAAVHCASDDCDELVSEFRQAYLTNVYDDLSRLQQAVPSLVAQLRQEQPYTQEQLSQMTTDQIKKNAAVIQRQRDCLPRLIDLIREIKNRIDQLEGMANTSAVPNRRASAHDRAIDDLLTAQEELRDEVDAALRRAGIGR